MQNMSFRDFEKNTIAGHIEMVPTRDFARDGRIAVLQALDDMAAKGFGVVGGVCDPLALAVVCGESGATSLAETDKEECFEPPQELHPLLDILHSRFLRPHEVSTSAFMRYITGHETFHADSTYLDNSDGSRRSGLRLVIQVAGCAAMFVAYAKNEDYHLAKAYLQAAAGPLPHKHRYLAASYQTQAATAIIVPESSTTPLLVVGSDGELERVEHAIHRGMPLEGPMKQPRDLLIVDTYAEHSNALQVGIPADVVRTPHH